MLSWGLQDADVWDVMSRYESLWRRMNYGVDCGCRRSCSRLLMAQGYRWDHDCEVMDMCITVCVQCMYVHMACTV